LFLEDPLDTVPAGVDGADAVEVPGGVDQPAQAVVDDGRRPAGLRHDEVSRPGHGSPRVALQGLYFPVGQDSNLDSRRVKIGILTHVNRAGAAAATGA